MKIPIISDWLKRYRTSPGTPLSKPESWFLNFLGLDETKAGANVNEWTALQCSAVFSCIRIIAETVATVPLHYYRRLDRGKERAYDQPLYDILHNQANPEISAYIFREMLQGHLASWGNAYAEIQRNKHGEVIALWPLRPDKTRPKRNKNGKIFYEIEIKGKGYILPKNRVLHIPAFGFDGLVGYNPIYLARESIGMALATEEYGGRLFKNDARPGGYLKHPAKLSPQAQKNLINSWEERHKGLENKHRVAVLEEGMEFQTVGIPPQESQFLQTRKFQIIEIARWYRMQLHKLGELDRATWNNMEQQAIEFVTDTMFPWFTRWESAIKTQLLNPEQRREYYAEFLIEGLLRGDTKARFDAYSIARQWGWMSANDIREKENQNPLPDKQGDIYLVPMNMIPADRVLDADDTRTTRMAGMMARSAKGKGAKIRLKLAKSYERMFADAAKRIVKREKADILKKGKQTLERSEQDFALWLEQFYQEAPVWMERMIRPVIFSYAEAMQAQAATEVGAAVEMTPELEKYMQGYTERWTQGHIYSSQGQIEAVMRDAAKEGADAYEAIETRLDEWEERRPGKIAKDETINAAGVVSKFVWAAAGITQLQWINTGEKTCPFCEELDGQVVGIDQPFLGKDDRLDSEDGEMYIRKPTFTPPVHQSCECMIEPV